MSIYKSYMRFLNREFGLTAGVDLRVNYNSAAVQCFGKSWIDDILRETHTHFIDRYGSTSSRKRNILRIRIMEQLRYHRTEFEMFLI